MILKSNIKSVKKGKIDTSNTQISQIQDCLIYWLGTGTSTKSGRM